MIRPDRIVSAVLLLVVALSYPAAAASASEWPQWRGPDRDGRVPGTGWPDSLSGLERSWRVELGRGYPGPVVGTDRVFVVESVDDETVAVRALALDDGSELWKQEWAGSGKVPFFARANGDWVRSTPVYDGETLFVGDMGEVLVAIDAESGDERWRVDLPTRHGTAAPDFGFASSPLVKGEHLFVQAANSLIKLDKRDGSTVWRRLAGSGKIQVSGAFSSPIIAEIAGVRQLVVLTRTTLYGVDPGEGTVLWSRDIPNFRGMNILTPVVWNDAILTSPYKERTFMLRVLRGADGFEVEESWTNPATGYMSSPVVVGDHAYLHLGNRRLDCIDLATGESRWRTESFGKYWSMAWQGDKILALDERGELLLIRADPSRFDLLDRRALGGDESWGHVAVAGERVLVRELEAISVYEWVAAAPAE
jgi:outer membrane protein assembly factor BamB